MFVGGMLLSLYVRVYVSAWAYVSARVLLASHCKASLIYAEKQAQCKP